MNLFKMTKALLLGATILGATANIASAEDDYYGGAQCQQMWTSSESVNRADGTIYNPTNRDVTVTCPLTIDDGGSRFYSAVNVWVRDTESTDDVSCRITSSEAWGTLFGPWVDSGTINVGARMLRLGSTNRWRTNSMTCKLPGNAANGYFIYRYLGRKN